MSDERTSAHLAALAMLVGRMPTENERRCHEPVKVNGVSGRCHLRATHKRGFGWYCEEHRKGGPAS